MVKQPTVISLFAGCGGSSLGYKWAGFKELLAIDFDRNSVETFKLNFSDVPIWERDIKEVTGEEILKFCNIQKGELDVLDGSPPCQGFSTAGKRQVNDSRNSLFLEFVRLIKDLSPKVFLIENVSGMVQGKMKGLFIEIMRILKELNYQVKCKLLNAKYYSVPQSRERLIWIGIRKDLNREPGFPEPNRETISIREAFDSLFNIGDIVRPKKEALRICKEMKEGEDGCDAFQRLNKTKSRRWFGMKRLQFNKPSNTIVKSLISGLIHPKEDRYLTINELKRVATFPDEYQMIGTFQEQWARLGNAVMPKFMKALANHIKINFLNQN